MSMPHPGRLSRRRLLLFAGLSVTGALTACGSASTPAPAAPPAAPPAASPAAAAPAAPPAAASPPAAPAAAPAAASPTSAPPPVAVSSPTTAPVAAVPQGKVGGRLRVALDSDIIGVDPHGASAGVDRSIYTSIYNALVTVTPKLEIVPDLAESWTTPDPTTYVFKLRPNVMFHDGTPCDAKAVKWNFDWILDPANASARRSELSELESVEAPDPLTVRIKTKNPFAPFLAIIADRAGYIVSPAAREKFGKDFTRNPVGTGPYQFVEWVKDDHVSFKRFDGYWGPKALLDEIRYRPIPDTSIRLTDLKTGNIDFIFQLDPRDVAELKTTPGMTVFEGPGVGYTGLWLQTAKGPLANRDLREAIAWAVDREGMLEAAYFGVGTVAHGPIPPSSWAYDPSFKPFTYDPAKAKAKLVSGGQPNGFTMTLLSPNQSVPQKIAQLVQAELGDVGIKAEIQVLEFGALLKAGETGDFDAMVLGWSGRIDPDGNIEPIFSTKGTFNYGKYNSPETDSLIAKARQSANREERKTIYQQLQRKVIQEDVAYIATYHGPTLFAASDKLKAFDLNPDGLMRFKTSWLDR